ncbi:MAG TPA: fused MFS/spermidine synthase [Planctomycetota bacterium]|nr:fused MFS/spermidine synthase [Planctomycetota bacterium]
MRPLVLAFFFVSGLCGLLYEVVWIRAAGTVIGNTTHAVGTVVGVFMGGLALGGCWGGRAADRRSGSALLSLYGLLEGGVALLALAVPLLITASEPLFRILWSALAGAPVVYGVLRALLVALILLPPTTLMGATLPILARFLSASVDAAGREAGRAYAINTLGGVIGTVAAGFWLIPELGLRVTTFIAAGLNVAIALASVAAARGKPGERLSAPPEGAPPPRLPLVVAALSGTASLLYEIAWTRSLVLALGSTVHAFTLILTAFILGLALGSAAASLLLSRLPRLPAALAIVQIAIGALAVALLPALGDLPLRVAPLAEGMHRDYGSMLATQAGFIGAFVLLPALFMGAVFPIAIRWASAGDRPVGRSVGAVYSANTLGSIVGSIAGSFVVVPLIGLASTVKVAATINLAVAAFLLAREAPRRWLGAIPAAVALGGWLLLPAWDPQVLTSGAFLYGAADVRSARFFQQDLRDYLRKDSELIAQYWDSYGLVTLHRQQDGILSMKVNGKTDASTGPTDRANMLFVGDLALVHHPSPKRALCIGLGGGLTLAALAKHPLERLDCVELSPAVVRGAAHFKEAIGGVLEDRRVNLVVGDGRNAILFGREPYDVIVSQPSNLWVSGMANLFTRDFFDEASRRLAPGGLFCQWVHAYYLSPENLKDVLRTFFDVYPHGSLWEVFPGHDYLLIGAREPLQTEYAGLEGRLASTKALEEYVGSEAPRAPGLLGHLVADAARVRESVGAGPLVSDDRCFIEYSAPRSMGHDTRPQVLEWMDALRRPSPLNTLYRDVSDGAADQISRHREMRRVLAEAVKIHVEDPDRALSTLAGSPVPLPRDPRTQRFVDLVADGVMFKAQSRLRSVDPRGAIELLRRIPKSASAYPGAQILMGETFVKLDRPREAEAAYQAAREVDPNSFEAAFGFARVLQIQQNYGEAEKAWQDVSRLRPEVSAPHVQRALCLKRLGRIDEARTAFRKALEIDPQDARAAELLKDLGKP